MIMSQNTAPKVMTRKDITESLAPVPETVMRTILPNRDIAPATTGANLIKVVEDYGQIEDEELEAEIMRLEVRLARARLKRQYVQKLQAVADEYKTAAKELENGIGVFQPK
jgi:hypothetical protein